MLRPPVPWGGGDSFALATALLTRSAAGYVPCRIFSKLSEYVADHHRAVAMPSKYRLGKGEDLIEGRLVSNEVVDHEFVPRVSDGATVVQSKSGCDGGVSIKRNAIPVAHGGQEEIQNDGVPAQVCDVLVHELPVDPGEPGSRNSSDAG